MARNEAIARLLYMHDVNPAALRAGLIDAVTDLPFCIMWLGGTYSVRKFVDVFLQHKIAQQIVMFSGGATSITQPAIPLSSGTTGSLLALMIRRPSHVVLMTRSFKRLRGPGRPSSRRMHAGSNLSSGSLAGRTHTVAAPMEAPVAVGAKRSFRAPSR